jgi:NADH-ubiquinone oxidoreductase chain 2
MILIVIGYTLQIYYINKEKYNIMKIKDINYSPVQLISQLKGYFNINPTLAISLSLTLFSFAGIPPLIGFFGKQLVLTAALNTNLFLIVIIAIITSVISAVYYLIIIKLMCFDNEKSMSNIKNEYYISSFYSFSISLITLFTVSFMVFEGDLYRVIQIIL